MLDRNLDNLFIDENLNADFFKSFSEKNIESLLKFCIKLRHEKKSLKAIDVLLLAQQKFPENIFILNTLANCYQECDQDDQAIVYYLMAIKINSSSPEIFHNLGNSYYKIKNYGKAIKSYEQAISINPRLAKSLQFLGNCFYNLGEVELAHDYYLKSLAIDDQQASPWIDYGVCCMALNLTDQAIINFEKALSISPTNNIARFNLGLCQLKVKKFIPGWFNYEARWETPSFSIYKREFQAPVWNGHYSLTNKTILIYAEQGFGDTIQFCRYIKNLKELGAKVIFEVQEPLMKLLGQLNVDHIIKYGDAHLYVFDYQCPLLSLPSPEYQSHFPM